MLRKICRKSRLKRGVAVMLKAYKYRIYPNNE
ncbi:MAG: helix-turn-helix domain-containing protein [Eubacterium sp.]